jgi:hypothetical protein
MSAAKTLDRHAASALLGVTTRQFRLLLGNPTFPKPIAGRPPDEEWDISAINQFAAKLQERAARGWKCPDCLFAWDSPITEEDIDRRRAARRNASMKD